MSRRLPLASGAAAALALVLMAPTAALADGHGQDGQDGSQAKDASGHNPPGNNGTIKIDYPAPADSGHANRPHPGCAFQLRMFGFDDDQYGSITFVGQAPTKLGTLLTQSHVLLSNDAAGGGQDVDETYSYTADELGLTGTPQAKQGWHVKVLVDADNAPGGAKQKVFWLSCPAATSSTAGSSAGGATASGAGAAGTATTTPAQESAGQSTAGASATTTASGGSTAGAATAGKGAGQASTFTGGGGSAALNATRPAAQNRGSALPFTGVALGTMVAIALGALAAGVLAIRAGRRRTTDV